MMTEDNGNRTKDEKCRAIYRMAVLALKILMLFIAFFLAFEGVRYSYYSSKNYEEVIFELADSAVFHVLCFVGICVLTGLALRAGNILTKNVLSEEKVCRGVLYIACIWLLMIGVFYIQKHPYYPIGDQINTTAGAAYAREGNYSMFAKGGYIGLYGQQKGLLFLYEILFTLFGDFCYDTAAYFHVCFNVITLVAGYAFLKIVANKPIYRILYCIMLMFCMPYIIYLPYIYGDLPSVCFSTVLFWALAAYGKRLQKRYIGIGCVFAALALLVRMNSWIVLIAVSIGMTLMAMQRRTLRPILAALCIIAVSWGTVRTIEKMYEYRSGFESGVGIPSILWIAMGLQETDGNPGVYNRYQQTVFEECDFERERAAQIGKEYILMRLKEFRKNPAYAKYFFTKKVKMQWLEPLFESLYATSSFRYEENEISHWISSLYWGKLHDIVWKFANYYQSVIYLAVLSFVIGGLWKKIPDPISGAGWIPLIAVVGGFLFSIIWESQCRYVFPYFMYLIMYASIGIGDVAEAIKQIGGNFIGKVSEVEEEESDTLVA